MMQQRLCPEEWLKTRLFYAQNLEKIKNAIKGAHAHYEQQGLLTFSAIIYFVFTSHIISRSVNKCSGCCTILESATNGLLVN